MQTELLERRFAEMGAKVKVRDLPQNRVTLDIQQKKEEIFDLGIGPQSRVQVVDIQPKDRHLLLLTESEGMKQHWLCGHDERHWFIAAIPRPVRDVRTAKEALRPAPVEQKLARTKRGEKKKDRRRSDAFVRQGEWFFVPTDFEPPAHLVLRNEPLLRSGRNRTVRAHMMEYAYRLPGRTVYVGLRGQTYTEEQFVAMSNIDRRRARIRVMSEVAALYAKGKISHIDHATIKLSTWHKVEMNTERDARHATTVQMYFLD